MVVVARGHRRRTVFARPDNGPLGALVAGPVTHAAIAVEDLGRGGLMHHADVGARVHVAAQHVIHIGARVPGAVAEGAAQVGADHQQGHDLGVFAGGAGLFEYGRDKGPQRLGRHPDAAFWWGVHLTFLAIMASHPFQGVIP